MFPMLDARSRQLLKTLIERYIVDGQPVGSRALARISGLELSPATIRNVMADLEDMGFVSSPHTSAGRVPTPRGYRLFVDSLLTVQPLELQQTELMQGQLQVADPSRAIQNAAQLLSRLSQFAGVVLTPRRSSAFRQVEFVRLSDKRVLLIIVTPEGDVQNRVLVTEASYTPSQPRGRMAHGTGVSNREDTVRTFAAPPANVDKTSPYIELPNEVKPSGFAHTKRVAAKQP